LFGRSRCWAAEMADADADDNPNFSAKADAPPSG
jgi:hypothetical protein